MNVILRATWFARAFLFMEALWFMRASWFARVSWPKSIFFLFLLSFGMKAGASNLDAFGFFWTNNDQTVKAQKAIQFEHDSNIVGVTHSTTSNKGKIRLDTEGIYEVIFRWSSVTPGAKVALFLNGQQVAASLNATGILDAVLLITAGGDVLTLKNASGQDFVLRGINGEVAAKLILKKIGDADQESPF